MGRRRSLRDLSAAAGVRARLLVPEAGFRLPLKLRVGQLHGNHGGEPLPDVVARDAVPGRRAVAVLQQLVLLRERVHNPGEGCLEPVEVGAAVGGADGVGVPEEGVVVPVGYPPVGVGEERGRRSLRVRLGRRGLVKESGGGSGGGVRERAALRGRRGEAGEDLEKSWSTRLRATFTSTPSERLLNVNTSVSGFCATRRAGIMQCVSLCPSVRHSTSLLGVAALHRATRDRNGSERGRCGAPSPGSATQGTRRFHPGT